MLRRLLSNNQLSGTLPASLGNLTALWRLCDHREQLARKASGCGFALWTEAGVVLRRGLDSNQLSGTLPASLGSLTALESLCVHGKQPACMQARCVRLCTLD